MCEDKRLKSDDELAQNLLFTSLHDEFSNELKLNLLDNNEEPSDGESDQVAGSDNSIYTNPAHVVQEEETREVVENNQL